MVCAGQAEARRLEARAGRLWLVASAGTGSGKCPGGAVSLAARSPFSRIMIAPAKLLSQACRPIQRQAAGREAGVAVGAVRR
jgi:hypothetical protein